MANRQLTASIVARAALSVLDNQLGFLNEVHRPYDDEFDKNINGYTVGDTVSIRRPANFTIRTGAVASTQDVVEGKETLVIDTQKGIDFGFTSEQLTLDIRDLTVRVIQPAMVRLINDIAKDCADTWVVRTHNLVGDPGQTINSFQDYMKGVERLNEIAAPMDNRCAALSPSDHAGVLGNQTSLFVNSIAQPGYRKANIGEIADTKPYMTQVAPTLTTGTRTGSLLVDQVLVATTSEYDAVRDTWTQTLHVDGFGGATQTVTAGEVFTIEDVYDVNPVNKAKLPYLKQFAVTADATAAASEVDLIITPPIIWAGAQQNVHVADGVTNLNDKAVTFVGTASTAYRQNMLWQKNAYTFATVPMVIPPGSVDAARRSRNGISVRVIPYYDGTNDISNWRLDVLYGKKVIDNRLATRMYGTA